MEVQDLDYVFMVQVGTKKLFLVFVRIGDVDSLRGVKNVRSAAAEIGVDRLVWLDLAHRGL